MTVASAAVLAAKAGTPGATATSGAAGKAGPQSPAEAFAAVLQSLGAGGQGDAMPVAGELPPDDAPAGDEALVTADQDTPQAAAAATMPIPPAATAAPTLPAAMLALAGQLAGAAPRATGSAADEAAALQGVDGADAKGHPQAGTASKTRAQDGSAGTGVALPIGAHDPASTAQAPAHPAEAALQLAAAAPAAADKPAPRIDLPPAFALHAAAPAPAQVDAPGASVPVHQAAVPSHPLDAAFAGDLAAEVKLMVDGGLQQAELRLNPAELGPLRIHLSLSAQTADLSFSAAHATTREGITQALPALRDLLAGQGLQLGHAGVGSGGTGQSAQDPGWQAPREVGAGGARAIGGSAAPQPVTVQVRKGSGMLDLYA